MQKEKYPWLRLKGETSLSYKFFTEYLEMGESRSLEKVREKMGKRKSYVRQLETWSSQYSWVERAQFYDDHIANRRLEITEEKLEEMYDLGMDNAKEVFEILIKIAKGDWYAEPIQIRAIKVFLDSIGFSSK